MGYCTSCGSEVPDGFSFCGKCGSPVNKKVEARVCQNCKNTIEDGMLFCNRCGTRYEPAPVIPVPPTPTPGPIPPRPATPVVSTTGLTVLSAICVLLCWPVAIYGFVCRSNAIKATTQYDADNYIKKGKNACYIGLAIMAIFYMIALSM